MHWLLIAYLLVLVFVAYRRDRFGHTATLRGAWLAFAGIPLSEFFFMLIKASNFRDARDLALTELWSEGFAWLLLAVSVYFLAGVVAPSAPLGSRDTFASAPPPPPPVPPSSAGSGSAGL